MEITSWSPYRSNFMKQLYLVGALLLLFCGSASAQFPHPTVNNDGTLRWPENFFLTNSALIKVALAYDQPINSGVPNGLGADLDWSRLKNVPAGIADGTDDGGGGGSFVNGASVTGANFIDSFDRRYLTVGTNVISVPALRVSVSTNTFTPDLGVSTRFEFTLTGNATLAAPTNVSTNAVGTEFRVWFVQGGNMTLSVATNYLFGLDVTGLTLTTNAGYRDLVTFSVRRTNVFDVIGISRGYAP
jgi:hypothetical protein